MKAYQYLQEFIQANPGVSRTEVFSDAGLQSALRNKGQRLLIAKGDNLATKRWNRRLNFLIREMRRKGVEVQIERKGRVAHYTIGEAVQLELPFDLKAEARNSFKVGVISDNETLRAAEEENQSLDFEALLATLDEEAVAPVTK